MLIIPHFWGWKEAVELKGDTQKGEEKPTRQDTQKTGKLLVVGDTTQTNYFGNYLTKLA